VQAGATFLERKNRRTKSMVRLRKVSQPANPATGSFPCKPTVFNLQCVVTPVGLTRNKPAVG